MPLNQLWRRPANAARVLWRANRGAAAAEFAIVVPALGLLLTGVLDLAQLANQGLMLDAGVRAGAGYAISCPANYPDLGLSCTSRITDIVTGSNTFAGTVTVSFPNAEYASTAEGYPQFCKCDDDSSITCNNDTENDGALCGAGPKHFYMTIQAVESGLTPLLQWAGFPSSISRTLTVRVS
jgi:Flp pilus assembly protein TadG